MAIGAVVPVEDQQAILAVFYAYSAGIDHKDWELFEQVWTEDCVMAWASPGEEVRPGSLFEGREFLVSEMERIHRRLDGSLHRVCNTRFLEYDGQSALCQTYVDAVLVREGAEGGDSFQVNGYYEDKLRKEDGQWRIADRRFAFLQALGNPFVPDIEHETEA